ncbi:hypothetical protein CLHOM_34670 [Clostridium homopropionicum DSM 5847]|uniref:Uncharacterized protein n=1 Tax=Clostridium homopropionicum DSM 5847 TaxID=1121318 RepID=A0A0L6Z6I0_9CLOT|nr:YkuS family protein [Clostridium homopropionicum]KOA18565.1 hypothetical protein CLHOM_34670 [Clostridium homopropionicum DSM 5847]SFF64723.1 Uncharacterised protein family (UPF0180) [Clostridium homopropionicum]
MAKIAVEDSLNDYAKYITSKGHDVEKFKANEKTHSSYFNNFDAVVVGEFDYNILDLKDEITYASGLNASILNTQDAVVPPQAINSTMLNENYTGKRKSFASVPTIFAYGRTTEQVKHEIDRVLSEIER